MFDFLNDLIESDFYKNNVPEIITISIISFALGCFLMWLYMKYIHMKCIENQNEELKTENQELSNEVSSLQSKVNDLTISCSELERKYKKYEFIEGIQEYHKDGLLDPALEEFTVKK